MIHKPLIGITCDTGLSTHTTPIPIFTVQEKYILPAIDHMDCIPVILPNIPHMDLESLVTKLDGFIITGSPYNVGAEWYGKHTDTTPESERDNKRDGFTIPLIQTIIAQQKPVLCICRGLQELNVAMGGTLQRDIHLQHGGYAHILTDPQLSFDGLYQVRQDIIITPNGVLADCNQGHLNATVNSIHGQAIDTLAHGLTVEAIAPQDHIIEAVSITDYPTFGIGVQWHPEHWQALQTPLNKNLFIRLATEAQKYTMRQQIHKETP